MTDLHHEALKRLAEEVTKDLPAMLDEQETAVTARLPDVAARIDPVLLRDAIDRTNRRFIATLAGDTELATDRAVHVELGAVCARAGLPLESVTSAYRIGARVSWRRMAARIEELGLGIGDVLVLAEGWLAFVEELAADSLEGYEREAAVVRGQRARARQALLHALLTHGDVADTAQRAAWPLPATLAAGIPLATAPLDDDGAVLNGTFEGGPVTIVPAERLHEVTVPLALGPAVTPDRAPVSLARARRVAALAAAGVLPTSGPLHWDEHLPALVVHADTAAADALAATRLAPLDGLPEQRRRMLTETLEAWLEHPGQPLQIARRLNLHPQTVRYRLARLREQFGRSLDDPGHRFELQLALRAARR